MDIKPTYYIRVKAIRSSNGKTHYGKMTIIINFWEVTTIGKANLKFYVPTEMLEENCYPVSESTLRENCSHILPEVNPF